MNSDMTLVFACLAMVVLVLIVGLRMYLVRVSEMKEGGIHPQSIATSSQAASQLKNTQAADNFKNLFEVPVLFYALMAVAIAIAIHASGFATARHSMN